jgi:hypothetical protein
MSSFGVGLVAFACIFGSALMGMLLRVYLPANHQSPETQRIVNLAAGITGTMAALVLGLLIASAKGSYDAQNNEVITIAAKIGLIDRGLAVYGPDAETSRDLLRSELNQAVARLWPKGHPSRDSFHTPGIAPKQLYATVQMLTPQSDIQRTIKTQVLATMVEVAEERQLIFEQQNNSVSEPLLVVLIFALAVNFLSLGLFAPRNATVIAAFCLCAMASAGAIFVMMELYHPFGGLIEIPSTTLSNALAQ